VEGAQTFVVAPSLLEADEATYEVDEIHSVADLLNDLVRDPSQSPALG
jgi:hypothetical protein